MWRLVAVLWGLAVLAGVSQALVADLADGASAVVAPGCAGVAAAVGPLGEGTAISVRADACTGPGGATLLTWREALATVGAAAWRRPGPSMTSIYVVVDRYAEQPDGAAPRSSVWTNEEAMAQWGPRPVIADADTPQKARATLDVVLWICGFGAVGLLAVAAMVGLARAVARGDVAVGVIWSR